MGLYENLAQGQSHYQHLIDESNYYNTAQQHCSARSGHAALVSGLQAPLMFKQPRLRPLNPPRSKKAIEPKVPLRAQSAMR